MNIIRNEYVTLWDVDDTLVMHSYKGGTRVKIQDPVEPHKFLDLMVNEPMIRLMKEEHARGSHIIVWSRGGHAWAYNVIKALELEYFVHTIMSKPLAYFDDKPVDDWLKYRVYIEPLTPYKNCNPKQRS